ncbi:hypothetical protein OV450_5728 [Actinobacteria bacterium OV450]|nr:hypothetical protein OV450_5728 [Actinobacteria bacterium OV450]
MIGGLPEGVDLSLLPASRLKGWRDTIGEVSPVMRRIRANGKQLPAFLQEAPERCEELRFRVAAAPTPEDLSTLWESEVAPYFRRC